MRVPRFVLGYLKKKLMPFSAALPDEVIGPGYRWRKTSGKSPNGKPLEPGQRHVKGLPKPFLRRWFILPKNRFMNIYLHEFIRDDEDRALHDHPWWNVSLLLVGRYVEVTPGYRSLAYLHPDFRDKSPPDKRTEYRAGDLKFRRATDAHRIELVRYHVGSHKRTKAKRQRGQPCWSLFITGPVIREWGFLCSTGWRSAGEFAQDGGC